jgi:excisionase family DNA binding protein
MLPGLPHTAQADSGFATTRETARYLQLSHYIVLKLIASGEIPHKRFGRYVRVRWSWLRSQAECEAWRHPPGDQREAWRPRENKA